jgi:hypothetical protein
MELGEDQLHHLRLGFATCSCRSPAHLTSAALSSGIQNVPCVAVCLDRGAVAGRPVGAQLEDQSASTARYHTPTLFHSHTSSLPCPTLSTSPGHPLPPYSTLPPIPRHPSPRLFALSFPVALHHPPPPANIVQPIALPFAATDLSSTAQIFKFTST